MNKENISNFYNEFSGRQIKVGVNERLISLMKRLKNLGFTENSRILELGCGVGAFTSLLSKKIKNGLVEAVDISDKSIENAKKLEKKNIQFSVGDVVYYQPKNSNFDFITLLDVIEHIPIEEHFNLFKNVSQISTEKTLTLINIPNPDFINYLHKHNPEGLQVIDQAIELPLLAETLDKNNLEIIYFEKYSIWEKEDYHFFVVRKKREFQLKHLSDERNMQEKISNKISKKIDQIKFS